jgi:hypothetical protein
MRVKGVLTALIIGAGFLGWMIAPAASASASTATPTVITTPEVEGPFYLCNLTSSLDACYGMATPNGYKEAVTLENYASYKFTYNVSTEEMQQSGTDLCLEFNASSGTYPVRMDTCTAGRVSQQWFSSGYTEYQLENGYDIGYCLEGSEVSGYGIPLTTSPCSNKYAGENWAAVTVS